MSGNINIGGGDDPAYRYKMPRTLGKIEGRGNGIKTVFVNAGDVAKALHRPPEYVTKWCAVELGAQSRYDSATGGGTVNGAHDTPTLQKLVNSFIDKWVLCPQCNLPETVMVITKKEEIMFDCKACGYWGMADMRHKLCTFILKNPPDAKNMALLPQGVAGAKKSKEDRRREKAEKANKGHGGDDHDDDENADDNAAHDEKEKSAANDDYQSRKEITDSDFITQKMDDVELQDDKSVIANKIEEILDKEGQTLDSALTQLQEVADQEQLAPEDLLGFVFEACFDDEIIKQLKGRHKLLAKLQAKSKSPAKTQAVLLKCIEHLCKQEPELVEKKKVALILKAFYDVDLIEEEAIVKWYEKGSKKEFGKKIREAAKAFVDWLQEADEESEEEDD